MADEFTIKTPAGQTVDRKLYVVYGNAGTAEEPDWGACGKRVEDSSAENDWSAESKQDILGDTYTTMKDPITTQEFDPCEVDAGDKYQAKLVQLAVVERNAAALANQDLLRVHRYLTNEKGECFAERFPSSAVEVTGLAGGGGGALTQPFNVTFGGTRQVGSVKYDETGKIPTFTPKQASEAV